MRLSYHLILPDLRIFDNLATGAINFLISLVAGSRPAIQLSVRSIIAIDQPHIATGLRVIDRLGEQIGIGDGRAAGPALGIAGAAVVGRERALEAALHRRELMAEVERAES